MPPPAWFPVVPGVANTIGTLKNRIIARACVVRAGAQAHHGRTIIAPLTLQAHLQVQHKIASFNYDPNLVAGYAHLPLAIGHLADVYFVRESARSVTACAVDILAPDVGGVSAFR